MELPIQSQLRERAAASTFDPMCKLLIAAASRIDELEDAVNRADLIDKMQAPDFGTVGAIQRAVSAVPGVAGVEVEAKPNSVHIIVDTVDHTAVAGDLAQAIRAAVPLNVATTGMTGWCGPLNVPLDDVRWTWKRDLPTESVCDCVESPHLRDPVHGCEDCRNTDMIYD